MGLDSILKTINAEEEGLLILTESDLTNLHRELLAFIEDISQFCEKHDIYWSLSGGNILGAIRHGGFIPWDDDIDINITREEFEKFKKVFPGELADKYSLSIPGDSNYIYHLPRIYKKGTRYRTIQSLDTDKNELFIDVFIMENTPNNLLKRYVTGIKSTYYLFAISAVRQYKCMDTLLKYTSHNKKAQDAIKKRLFIGRLLSIRSLEQWIKKGYRQFSSCTDNNSIDVVIPAGVKHYFGEIYKRDKICKYKSVQFESLNLPVPIDAEYYLKTRYGDNYRIIPEKSKQEKHAIIEFEI